MIPGIIICHGQLAGGYIQSAQKILGERAHLHAFSNDKLSTRGLYERIRRLIEQQAYDSGILMVDLRGGSCWAAARMVSKDFPGFKTLSGINIPMLISFLTKRENFPFDDLVRILEEDAHRGIQLD